MATIKDFAIKYANEIYIAEDKIATINDIKFKSSKLLKNNKPISLEDLEELWTEIENELYKKSFSLYENQNQNFLKAVSSTLKEIKRQKADAERRSK
ncbi:hypothetical protein P5F35_05600 [Clostridium perfringens]|nr:hypothetical protein [Clostridium perfringens]